MRVLHVINSLGVGGAERSLAELLPQLSRAGIDNSVVCLYVNPAGVHPKVEAAGYRVDVVGRARGPALRRIRALLREQRPDLVHTTIFDADILGRVATVGLPCRVLTSLVNTTYDGVRLADTSIPSWKLAGAKAVDRLTARRLTDHFHAISGAVRDSAVRHLGIRPEQITVVERGRDLSRLGEPGTDRRAMVRERLGLAEDAEVVLHVGRQERQKGLEGLLEAVARLAPAHPRLVLVQAGRPGLSTPELERRCQQPDLAGRVRFLGQYDAVGDLLSAADVFAFPSIYEGLGGSLLEAMAMGLPSVVTDVPALVDVVEGGVAGLVVPNGDAGRLAAGIAQLLDDPDFATAMGKRARQVFDRRFTLEHSARGMVDLYESVLTTPDSSAITRASRGVRPQTNR